MSTSYVITPKIRKRLKSPFGKLIKGSFSKTMYEIEKIISTEKPSKIISVGDIVSNNLHQHGIISHIVITDNKSRRKPIAPKLFTEKKIKVKNPPGMITKEAIKTVQIAIKSREPIQILVEGEEDLLTLIAVLHSPENSLVFYGQPDEGVVYIKTTEETKNKVLKILSDMTKVED